MLKYQSTKKVYLCKISEICDFSSLKLLSPDRRSRFHRMRRAEDKKRCLAGGLLLRYLLKDDVNRIEMSGHGKPYLPGSGVFFNLSHSGDFVALATDKDEIGVDIQRISAVSERVFERCFTDEELNWLKTRKNRGEAFCRLWAGKESVVKAVGRGLSMPFKSFSVMPPLDGLHSINGEALYLHWYPLDGYSLCVSSRDHARAELVSLSIKELTGTY